MRTALVVEDDIAHQSLYSRILENIGYKVICADDGVIAIQRLKNEPQPHLIILDIRMPNANGLDVIDFLQSYPNIENIHVIIASATRSYEECRDMLPSAEFMLKPIMPAPLQAATQGLLMP